MYFMQLLSVLQLFYLLKILDNCMVILSGCTERDDSVSKLISRD